MFEQYNSLLFDDISVAKAKFRGAIAMHGKAELADFDVGADKMCDKNRRAVRVGQRQRDASQHAHDVLQPRGTVRRGAQRRPGVRRRAALGDGQRHHDVHAGREELLVLHVLQAAHGRAAAGEPLGLRRRRQVAQCGDCGFGAAQRVPQLPRGGLKPAVHDDRVLRDALVVRVLQREVLFEAYRIRHCAPIRRGGIHELIRSAPRAKLRLDEIWSTTWLREFLYELGCVKIREKP
ncbi:hypothetical protein FGB62_31g111 [Gracilaria domingensis]|nr:hypothetical protein FGB62_31g111 [Gracilaria domingensis]